MNILNQLADIVRILTKRSGVMTIPEMTEALTDLGNSGSTAVPADIAVIERTASVVMIPAGVTHIHKDMFKQWEGTLTDIFCGFAEGAVSGAPWGAPSSVNIHYMEA